ncbi:MAG TPA: DUF2309 domain-containing protein [Pirellulaceae bacterium]|nr:DUF2309 domain-containing protein [Pirellulaceae bacterium]HMO92544.1 DUF2309 domain-containing protein [Pirellulaceae bacterium]HMP68974.1 DUF2309 domain-containing protein [Pirellulaceae bacterium]
MNPQESEISEFDIIHAVEKAAHLLPAQGPITTFVHHNTLHAFESLPFFEAIRHAEILFECKCLLPEKTYRAAVEHGRISNQDLEASLIEDLGDQADRFVGLLGTRYHLRLALLQHELNTLLPNELDWIMAETEALDRLRIDIDSARRNLFIEGTRRWMLRNRLDVFKSADSVVEPRVTLTAKKLIDRVLLDFQGAPIEDWNDARWETFTLRLLWEICSYRISQFPDKTKRNLFVRHRDVLLSTAQIDSDERVNEVLIPFCLAWLDQGLAATQIPHREQGFYQCFLTLYKIPSPTFGGRSSALQRIVQDASVRNLSATASICESLLDLGIGATEVEDFISASLLALRGFAGMIHQLETRGDRVPFPAQTGSLLEFLAVRLMIDRVILGEISRQALGFSGPLCDLRVSLNQGREVDRETQIRCETFTIHQLAQALGWTPEVLLNLSKPNWNRLLNEIREFDLLSRLRVFHAAWERRFRINTLDALSTHSQRKLKSLNVPSATKLTAFDVVCCIDDREESFRRHIEEIATDARTWGVAGFFNVPMYYQGADFFHFLPLCPIVIKPTHYVREHVHVDHRDIHERNVTTRRNLGRIVNGLNRGSHHLISGALTSFLGLLTTVPLMLRVLFPRFSARFRHKVSGLFAVPKQTYLQLERERADPGPDDRQVGFSLIEMVEMVERFLRDIGMVSDFSELVLIIGHGSSSLNNPHESAYNCGACGGGRGGPNARVMARMANDVRVRAGLRERGLEIPQSTLFLGLYHNTCDDSLSWFDGSSIPHDHVGVVGYAKSVLAEARKRNAHERCRRFESADLSITVDAALRHVEARAEDLSQTRPEYNHATNAICIVGRRARTRGLFLDRRAFLVSYDPNLDDEESTILARILAAVVPVCTGINLEYFFSAVDVKGFGCGTKLPHNVAALLGVMDGAASDLRTGLSAQMVEIHEPLRLLFVIESRPEVLQKIMSSSQLIRRIFCGHWAQLAILNPDNAGLLVFNGTTFEPYQPESSRLESVASSLNWYRGWRGDLRFAEIH